MSKYKPVIIIDNDSLVNLTGLSKFNIFNLLRNIFSQILIPEEVKNEYEKQQIKESRREFILRKLRPDEGFWALCTRYDTLNKSLLFSHKGIDKGEAEIISQSEKTGIRLIISDDKNFAKTGYDLNNNLRIYNTLFVIAVLDIHEYLPDNIKVFSELYKIRKFKHNDLIDAYKQASKYFSLNYHPVKISKNTFKRILSKL